MVEEGEVREIEGGPRVEKRGKFNMGSCKTDGQDGQDKTKRLERPPKHKHINHSPVARQFVDTGEMPQKRRRKDKTQKQTMQG